MQCHAAMRGIGEAHAAERLGCSPCHGGDPSAREASAAHSGMSLFAGELSTVAQRCGQAGCHPSEAARVQLSPMTTAAGILGIDKFAFGERERPEVTQADSLAGWQKAPLTAAEDHVRKLCGSCHLGAPKRERGDLGLCARGGGCTACHLSAPEAVPVATASALHPAVSSVVPERRCEGCHARSGRIALSFRGRAEVEQAEATEQLPDGRPIARQPPDVHARAGMTCIDCHAERDVMGDGRFHAHAADAVEVRCLDCHAPQLSAAPASLDALQVAARLARSWERRGGPALVGGQPIVLQRGTLLFRTDVATRSLLLAESTQSRALPPLRSGPEHGLRGHARLSCQACHAQWAPRCISCHTERVADEPGFDHVLERETPGAFRERAGGNGFGLPALALSASAQIEPFVEGMRLQLSGVGPELRARELWAPLDPHTSGPARSCASCHVIDESAERPTYPTRGETTRTGARLLGPEERARIAQVGRCIACHGSYADSIYQDFGASLDRLRHAQRPGADGRVRRCQGQLSAALPRSAGPHGRRER